MTASVILLSAGLDSAVNFKLALSKGHVSAALTFDYGQRAARREVESATAMCERFGIRHEIIALPWLADITTSALVNREATLPRPEEADLDHEARSNESAASVWVPNRNGIFLAIGAGYAEALDADRVLAGFNAEEAASFPDNSEAFIRAYNRSLRFSTRTGIQVVCHTNNMDKTAIVKLGFEVCAPLDLAWCCYEGGQTLCGECESCKRFLRAARDSGCMEWFRRHHPRMPASKSPARNVQSKGTTP